jgi:ATP-dependent Lon protease
MEVISLSGYTPNEKQEIARQFLVPKQLEAHGLSADKVTFTADGLKTLIERYTREAGVRNLEREIGSLFRKVARRVVQEKGQVEIEIDPDVVGELLGKPKYRPRRKNEESEVGVATGLAWTEAGGELLETEVGLMRGKGKLTLTGQLGDVMQESARAAVSYLRSRADLLGIDPDFNETNDLHLHVPEGAIPKDGPSAGITMATALVSALTQIPVRKDVAMTGEITLRGKVLPVGGIKDKVLAAYRAGITELIMPQENEKDLDDIPEEIRAVLEVHLIDSMDEVLRLALDAPIAPLPGAKGKIEGTTSEPPAAGGDSLAH